MFPTQGLLLLAANGQGLAQAGRI